MTTPLDEATAWDLIRAVPPGPAGADGTRVRHPDDADDWLRVEAGGSWSTSSPCTDAARQLFDLYLPLRLRTDLVIAQVGQSLDGRIATETGHSFYVTGPDDLDRLHRLRALVDAVLVGANTAVHDDPRLTVRRVVGDDPVRVLLDPGGRVDRSNRLFRHADGRTLVVQRRDGAGTTPGRDTILLPADEDGVVDPRQIVAALRERGLRRLLVEGGGITVSRFLQAGALNRLHVTVAPVLLGSGRPTLILEAIDTMDQALRPPCRRFDLGDDLLFDLDLDSEGS